MKLARITCALAVGGCLTFASRAVIAETPVSTAVYRATQDAVHSTPIQYRYYRSYYRPNTSYYRPYTAYRPYAANRPYYGGYRSYGYRPYYGRPSAYGYYGRPYTYGYRAYPGYYGYGTYNRGPRVGFGIW